MSTLEPPVPVVTRGRLRALFDEAWQRRRRRHRRFAAVVVLLVAGVSATVLASRGDEQQANRAAPGARLPALVLSQAPGTGIGVACPAAPNSIACDQVGIAAFLPVADAQLSATIGGRTVRLRNRSTGACPSTGCFYSAYMSHAGLLDGALRVHPDAGRYRWYGRHPVTATIRLTATYKDGTQAQTIRHTELAPGWG